MQGTVKAVQKAKLLVSQALNTPSGAAQMQTPNLSSSTSSQVHAQSTSSAAPVRGNFAAIPSSSAEWPTVAQANRMGSTREQPTSSKNVLNKAMSVSEHGNDKVQGDTRETRAHSAPDLFCELDEDRGSAGNRVWSTDRSTDTRNNSSTSYSASFVDDAGSFSRVVSTAGSNSSSASSTTKSRSNSYALPQDGGSRLSYCEVATRVDNGSGKMEDTNKVCITVGK